MRFTDKLKNLKVGDTVVVHENYSTRTIPYEAPITKVGKKFLYIDGRHYNKFSIDRGVGDFGMYIYPGTLTDYNDRIETLKLIGEVRKLFAHECENMTKAEILEIKKIIEG